MPLLPGKKNIGRNIQTEQAVGKPHDQAVAIAMNTARGKVKQAEKKSPSWNALHSKAVEAAKAKRHAKGGRR
jgi:signal recognition particle subunit SEC65